MNEDITEEAIIISVPDHEIVLDPEPDYIKLEKNVTAPQA